MVGFSIVTSLIILNTSLLEIANSEINANMLQPYVPLLQIYSSATQ